VADIAAGAGGLLGEVVLLRGADGVADMEVRAGQVRRVVCGQLHLLPAVPLESVDWGRFLWAQEPNFENCGPWGGQISLKPYTGQYCQSLYSENGTAVASDLPVNATLRPPYLLLAFAAPTAAKGLFTVTPIPPATVTVTHTVPVTTTVTQTATKTETVTVTATQTVLVNTTITVPTTVTHTVTATATQTVTLTSPTTVTKNYTTTYTVTVTQPGISLDPTAAAVLSTVAVALLIAAIACSRCATKAQTPSS